MSAGHKKEPYSHPFNLLSLLPILDNPRSVRLTDHSPHSWTSLKHISLLSTMRLSLLPTLGLIAAAVSLPSQEGVEAAHEKRQATVTECTLQDGGKKCIIQV